VIKVRREKTSTNLHGRNHADGLSYFLDVLNV
jgi:hypothetical protein